ncbi:MAG: HEAT repeat domain-containing protein, partial [Gammaproteobacteria bacterium]|nr:HEAT repeat domain-containing protein [Gammaproteobacteria bacterium]
MLTGLRTLLLLPVLIGSVVAAQSTDSEREELKIAALEALMSSPSERALPLVMRVLDGDGSDELKERALFVLSQIDHPDAHDRILTVARNGSPELREEAIRMIGIAGDKDTLAGLAEMYE